MAGFWSRVRDSFTAVFGATSGIQVAPAGPASPGPAQDPTAIAQSLIKPFEGWRERAYHCPAGYPTIGWGRKLSDEKNGPLPAAPTTPAAEQPWMDRETAMLLASVARLITVKLTPAQGGALIDFAYNLGTGALQASTLRQRLNRGDYDGAAEELMRWVKAGGKTLPGLVRRRQAERDLFEAGRPPD